METKTDLFYQVALTLLPNVGPVVARNLIHWCGSPEEVFRQSEKLLLKIPDIGPVTAKGIIQQDVFSRAEAELRYIEEKGIVPLFYQRAEYPARLKHCSDAPILLYFKGSGGYQAARCIGIVGTRKATEYGIQVTHQLVEDLKPYGSTIVSGLAFGIDYQAHKAALKAGVNTIGVLAHGLDRLYPEVHRSVANRMIRQGGLMTEYPSGTIPERNNFPARNRIVAGLCDAILVVEAGEKGGALITADIAISYNRDVLAVPGRIQDHMSAGTNRLINRNRAALVTSAKEIAYALGWDLPEDKAMQLKEKGMIKQKQLFPELNQDEQLIYDLLRKEDSVHIDQLQVESLMHSGRLSMTLLSLEMMQLVKNLPGKRYACI